MRSYNHSEEIIQLLKKRKYRHLGLVPTMGSLHKGHTKLIEECLMSCDETIVSIFVNPTQFSNKNDLASYPKSVKKDIETVKTINPNAIIYTPKISDIYNSSVKAEIFNLEGIDELIEGKYRKGHFQGVATIVKILFDKFSPNYAFFGEKDYQQILVVKKLIKMYKLKIKIKSILTVREENGLAMSSRNILLDKRTRHDAKIIYESLCMVKRLIETKNFNEINDFITDLYQSNDKFNLEYFCIAEDYSLKKAKSLDSKSKLRAFISVNAKGIRLIDNIALF